MSYKISVNKLFITIVCIIALIFNDDVFKIYIAAYYINFLFIQKTHCKFQNKNISACLIYQ